LEQCNAALGLYPNYARAHTISTLVAVLTGQSHEAAAAMKRVISNSGDEPFYRVILAYAYAGDGKAAEARSILRELHAGQTNIAVCYYFSTVYCALRDQNEAMTWLETAYRERAANVISIRVDPALDCLRLNPRFQRLLDGIRF